MAHDKKALAPLSRIARAGFPGRMPVLMKTDLEPTWVVDGVKVYEIPGWEGVYGVTKCGRVWSATRKARSAIQGEVLRKGRWLRPGKTPRGYLLVALCRDGKPTSVVVHQLVMRTFLGDPPKGLHCDHIDRDRTNNNVSNLRWATASQNQCNKTPTKGRRFKGVYEEERFWTAQIKFRNKKSYLGSFSTEREAAQAYNDAAIKLHGEFAVLNDLSE